jgi:hypothetical protein
MEKHSDTVDKILEKITTTNDTFTKSVIETLSSLREDSKEFARMEDSKIWAEMRQRDEAVYRKISEKVSERNDMFDAVDVKQDQIMDGLNELKGLINKVRWYGTGAIAVISFVIFLISKGIIKIG